MNVPQRLREHFDSFLPREPDEFVRSDKHGLGVARFDRVPVPSLVTFLTVGLALDELRQPTGFLRHELLLCSAQRFSHLDWSAILLAIAATLRSRGAALLLGEVLDMRHPFLGSEYADIQAFVASPTLHFPEEFDLLTDVEPRLIVAELLPLRRDHLVLIRDDGFDAYMDAIHDGRIDPYDLSS